MLRPRHPAHRNAGFTLIEIMVVVVILGILAALVVPQVMSRPDQAKVTVAKGDIKAVAAYYQRLHNPGAAQAPAKP